MTSLLDDVEILTALITDFHAIVFHTLRHLLHLLIVIIHCALATFIRISDIRKTPLKYCLRFLHFTLTL